MDKLIAELRRLYFLHPQPWHSQKLDASGRAVDAGQGVITPEIVADSLAGNSTVMLNLVSADGLVRAMIIGFEEATDWAKVAELYQGVQEDLELPAPALSVSGKAGYQLWFSVAEGIPAAQAEAFLNGVRLKYLAEVSPAHVNFFPAVGDCAGSARGLLNLVPALDLASGKWSAFIDPTMGNLFVDEPGLDMAPNMDRQADILSRLESIGADDFSSALNRLQIPADERAARAEPSALEPSESATRSAEAFFATTRTIALPRRLLWTACATFR